MILLLLAFRIVCGASVHLAELYVEKVRSARRITADLFMLMLFAVAILQVVDATTTAGFLLRLFAPAVVLVVWALMAGPLHARRRASRSLQAGLRRRVG